MDMFISDHLQQRSDPPRVHVRQVSRSLQACQGAVLLCDAVQGEGVEGPR